MATIEQVIADLTDFVNADIGKGTLHIESVYLALQALRKLAEYEDTGLSPAEVAELAQAKADGRVVVLPVSVGDTVYRACGLNVIDWTIERIVIFTDEIIFIDDSDNDFKTGDIGKTVFLTREEAEKALKEREDT